MVFYKGSISYETGQSLPIDEVYRLNEDADRILEEAKKNGI